MKQKTSANVIGVREREIRALELRKGGMTYGQIAAQLTAEENAEREKRGVDLRKPFTMQSAYAAVKRVLDRYAKKCAESVAELRQVEGQRLDRLQAAIYEKALQGHLGSVDRVLRIMQRRADLLGLDYEPGDMGGDTNFTLTLVQKKDETEEPSEP